MRAHTQYAKYTFCDSDSPPGAPARLLERTLICQPAVDLEQMDLTSNHFCTPQAKALLQLFGVTADPMSALGLILVEVQTQTFLCKSCAHCLFFFFSYMSFHQYVSKNKQKTKQSHFHYFYANQGGPNFFVQRPHTEKRKLELENSSTFLKLSKCQEHLENEA